MASLSQQKIILVCCFVLIALTTGFSVTPKSGILSNNKLKNQHQSGKSEANVHTKNAVQSAWVKRKSTVDVHASQSSASNEPSTTGVVLERSNTGRKIIIAGAPASGKGTQCELLKTELGVVHLSTGDMLREAVKKGTEVGLKAKTFMESGQLVPDEVIIGIVKDRLAEEDCQKCGWLLDGFPRTRAQADALEAAGIVADQFVLLEVPDEMLIERVVGRRLDPTTGAIYHLTFFPPPEDEEIKSRLVHRADDTEEKARVRLEMYHNNIDSIIGCYENIATRIDGTKPKAEVFSCIQAAIEK